MENARNFLVKGKNFVDFVLLALCVRPYCDETNQPNSRQIPFFGSQEPCL